MDNLDTQLDNNFNIIIPVYQDLELSEKVSIKRFFDVTSENKYDVYFIVPSGADFVSNLKAYLKYECDKDFESDYKIQEFDAIYFLDKYTYSKLLLSSFFYKTWLDMGYKKSYIYQTDCYLFRDEFTEWAGKDYDFIGAPIVATNSDWGYYGGYVGNGGFSLRNNQTMYLITDREGALWQRCKDVFENEKLQKNSEYKYIDYEDIFICKLVAKYWHLNLPSCEVAAQFAFDRNPDVTSEKYNVECPMCAHNYMLMYKWWEKFTDVFETNEELLQAAKDKVTEWNNIDHAEEHGIQYADELL